MRRAIAALALLAGCGSNAEAPTLPAVSDDVEASFASHYENRVGPGTLTASAPPICPEGALAFQNAALEPGAVGPLILEPEGAAPARDAVVLIHGLSDSPYFLCAIASRFAAEGAAIVMPLLTGHGLKEPLEEIHQGDLRARWREDVAHAVAVAGALAERVSIGGLSTGGLLAVDAALREPEAIDGGVYLYSAAIELPGSAQFLGSLAAWGLEGPLAWYLRTSEDDATNDHPNRARSWFSYFATLQVELLGREVRAELEKTKLAQPLFYAHSVDDPSALISGARRVAGRASNVEAFEIDHEADENCQIFDSSQCRPEQRKTEREQQCPVRHASVVLETPILLEDDVICEPANPLFDPMMEKAIGHFRALE